MQDSIEAKAERQAGHFEFDLGIVHNFSDGLYAKQVTLPANSEVISHKHNYSHLSILAKGRVILRVDGARDAEYIGPACIEIKAGLNHEIHALEDSVWYCIHATDECDPDKVDEVLISK